MAINDRDRFYSASEAARAGSTAPRSPTAANASGGSFFGGGQDEYSPLLDPQAGGIFGLIGRLQGRPTYQQHLVNQQQDMRVSGLRGLQASIQQTGDVTRGLTTFLGTPEGQEAFATDPNFFINVHAALRGPQPTAEMRNRQREAQLRGVSAAELERQKAAGLDTPKAQAWNRLIERGLATEDQRDMNLSGATTLRPRLDQFGNVAGYDVVNSVTGEILNRYSEDQLSPQDKADMEEASGTPAAPTEGQAPAVPGQQAAPQPAPVPGQPQQPAVPQQPAAPQQRTIPGAEDLTPQEQQEVAEVADTLISGAGWIPRIINGVGNALGGPIPSAVNNEVNEARGWLEGVRLAGLRMKPSGRTLQLETQALDDIVDNTGFIESPRGVANNLIRLHDLLDNWESTAQRQIQQPGRSEQVRIAADELLQQIEGLRAQIPGRTVLEQAREQAGARTQLELLDSFLGTDFEGAARNAGINTEDVQPAAAPSTPPGGSPPAGPGAPAAPQQPQVPGATPPEGVGPAPGISAPQTQTEVDMAPARAARLNDESARQLGDRVAQGATGQTTPALERAYNAISDTVQGFNLALADSLGGAMTMAAVTSPVGLVNGAMRNVGAVLQGEEPEPLDFDRATNLLHDAFESAGITPGRQAIENFGNKLGREIFTNSVGLASMLAAAPVAVSMNATALGRAIGSYADDLLRASRDMPIRTALTEIGASMGITTARESEGLKAANKGVRVAAEFAGAMIGGGLMTGGLLNVLGLAAGRRFGAVPKSEVPDRPLLREGDTSMPEELIRSAATEAVEADRLRVTNSINSTIDRFAPAIVSSGDVDAARNFVKRVRESFVRAREVEQRMWDGLPRTTDATRATRDLAEYAQGRLATVEGMGPRDANALLPRSLLSRIANRSGQTPKGRVTRKTSVQTLFSWREQIRSAMRRDNLSGAVRRELAALDEQVTDAMAKSWPDPAQGERARAYSRWLNERFTRGPFAPLTRRSKDIMESGNVLPTVKRAIESERGSEYTRSLIERGDVLGQGVFGGQHRAVTALVRDSVDDAAETARRRARDARASGNEVEAKAAEAAARKMEKELQSPKVRRFMQEFPGFAVEADRAAADLAEHLKRADQIEQSAFKLFSDAPPEDVLARLLTHPERGRLSREIADGLAEADIPEATRALQVAFAKRMISGPDGKLLSGAQAAANLQNHAEVARNILGRDAYSRLFRLVEATTGRTTLLGAAQRVGGIAGAVVGRGLGTGTIQVPAITANAIGKASRAIVSQVHTPSMVSRALYDPRLEALVLAREPTNIKGFKGLDKTLRRTIFLLSQTTTLGGELAGANRNEQ